MFNRRDFIKMSSLLVGSAGLAKPVSVFAAEKKPTGYFGVHPFVEMHPEAVFIMRTQVDSKTNSEACRRVGLDFGRTLLVPMDNTGAPVSSHIATKANLTAHSPVDEKKGLKLEDTMGICTDVFFVEGMFNALMEMGVPGKNMHTRDVNGARIVEARGYVAMAERTGATVAGKTTRITSEDDARDESTFVWRETPDGVVYEQIPYLWPINAPGSWNMNLAKFKAHEMGLTLTCKNLQGTNANPYQGYCQKWSNIDRMQKLEKVLKWETINPKVHDIIDPSFARHQRTLPRFDIPTYPEKYKGTAARLLQEYDPLCMEMWAHRTIDNIATSDQKIHVIEGIYGRDGDFNWGPNPYNNDDSRDPLGVARDYMTNVVIFGKNPYLVDNIGHWLGGHEPGNFALFHIAMERGKVGMLNPMNIPIYEWVDGVPVRRPLTSFTRTPLKTFHLLKYQTDEPYWHLVNEPFDYSTVNETLPQMPSRPTSQVFNQHYPSANYPVMAIEIGIPKPGWVQVEVLDRDGATLEVIMNAICDGGYHMAAWDTSKYTSGAYKYRFRYDDFTEVRDISLNKA